MQGPSQKPLAVHKLHGSYREDRHGKPKAAVTTADGVPKKPLGLDEPSGQLWEFVCRERSPWLSMSDAPALQALCELWSLRERTLKLLQADPTDKLIRVAFTSYHNAFEGLLAKFGMTPTDRARLGEVTLDEYDPAAEYVR